MESYVIFIFLRFYLEYLVQPIGCILFQTKKYIIIVLSSQIKLYWKNEGPIRNNLTGRYGF